MNYNCEPLQYLRILRPCCINQAAGGDVALLNLPCSSDIDALNLPTNKLILLPPVRQYVCVCRLDTLSC